MTETKNKIKIKKSRPKRSLRSSVGSLGQVWSIEPVTAADCLWTQGRADRSEFGEEIRVAVWNMQKGVGGYLFEHDFRSLCYGSELVLTQEALLSDRSMRTFREPGFELIHAASYRRRDGLRDGVMTASRVPSHPDALRVVCKYPEPLFRTPKVALVNSYPLAGRAESLLVINLHATLVRSARGAGEEMLHLLEHLPEHSGPIILAGDFNTFTPNYLRSITNVLRQIDLHFVPIPGDPRPQTQALDQVFVRGIDVKQIKIDTMIKNSDHFPVVATLKFK